MTAPQADPTKSVQRTLSLLSDSRTLPELLGSWTIESVISHDIELQFVTEQVSVEVVKTLMHLCDFSQIPVLSGDSRQIRGTVTWKSLARFGNARETTAGGVMARGGKTAELDDPLLDHIETIIDDDFLFVFGDQGIISYIVTTTDLADSFYEVAGPFMKLREIEKRIRHILDRNFSSDDLRGTLHNVGDVTRINSMDDLNFGHYVEIIGRPTYWDQIGLPFDRSTIVKHLHQVNQVRNSVMHFRPEPLTKQQSLVLDWCLNWLTECDSIGY